MAETPLPSLPLRTRIVRAIFGGDPKENERRYMANADLVNLTHIAWPWTEQALRAEVRRWLDG